MTINKAIEIQMLYLTPPIHPCLTGEPELIEAIKLGKEALIATQYVRRNYPDIIIAPLPGETRD